MNESYKRTNELEDRLEKDLISSIQSNNLTSDEVRRAYFFMCGVSEGPESEKVLDVSYLMDKMSKKGYPLNKFAEIIGGLQKLENSDTEFTHFVNGLNITQNEKDMLQSIVRNTRSGQLTCMFDDDLITELHIEKAPSSQKLAYVLQSILEEKLSQLPHTDIENEISFSFEEE